MKSVLSNLVLAESSHRDYMSKHELAYKVMDLPPVKRSFSDVSVVGFYHRGNLTESTADGRTIVYSDRTEYSAYAERCRETTVIKNRANAREENRLTEEEVAAMNFREFAETVSHAWVQDRDAQPEEIDPATTRKFMTRDVNSGYWELRRRSKRIHVRFSTTLYTAPAHLYEPVLAEDSGPRTDFFQLPVDERRQLYRAYMELVCYVPWRDSPEDTFISDPADRAMLRDALQVSQFVFRVTF